MWAKFLGCKKSWTIWFNSLVLAAIPLVDYVHSNFQELQPYMSESTFKVVGIVVVVANIALRFKTVKSLGDK